VVLTNESKEGYQNHRAAYIDRFQPADPVEVDLVDQMVSATWRLHRTWVVETTAIEREMVRITPELEAQYENLKQESRLCVAMQNLMEEPRFLANLGSHESRIARLYHRALQSLLKLRELGKKPAPSSSPNASVSPPPPQGNEISQNEPESIAAKTVTDSISSSCSLPLPPRQDKIPQNEPEPAEPKTETGPVSRSCPPQAVPPAKQNFAKRTQAPKSGYQYPAPLRKGRKLFVSSAPSASLR